MLALAVVVWLAELGYAAAFVGRTDAVGVWLVGIFPPGRVFEFAVGVLVGLAFARRRVELPCGRGWETAQEVAAAAGLLLLAGFAGKVPVLLKANGYYTAAMAVVIWTFARQRGRLSDVFASRPAVYLGEISYAFYLLHCLVFFHTHQLIGREPLGTPGLAAASVLATLLLSAIVYRWVEQPARRWVVGRVARNPEKTSRTIPHDSARSEQEGLKTGFVRIVRNREGSCG